MRKILALTGILLLVLMMISCDGDGGGTTNYFPTTNLSLWNYDDILNVTTQSGDRSYRLNGTANHNTQGSLQVLEVYYNGTYDHSLYLKANSNEVSWYFDLTSDEHFELIQYPLTVGKTWNWTRMGFTATAVVQAEESQTVPAGTFSNCMKIEYYIDGDLANTMWFAPNVGMVRDYISGYDYRLFEYNIPS